MNYDFKYLTTKMRIENLHKRKQKTKAKKKEGKNCKKKQQESKRHYTKLSIFYMRTSSFTIKKVKEKDLRVKSGIRYLLRQLMFWDIMVVLY